MAAVPHSTDQFRPALTVPVSRWRRLRRRTYEVLSVASDGDQLSRIVDITLITLIALSVFAIVLESMQTIYAQYAQWFWRFEQITVVIFSFEYALRLWSSVESPEFGHSRRHALRSRLRYIRSPSAIVDLVAILPFYFFSAGLFASTDLRFLRALRLLRVLKLTRYSSAFETLTDVYRDNRRSLTAAFFILMIVMLIASTGIYYFEHKAQPEDFSSIPASMWWAFAALTTVGYGDVTPITTGGRVFGALITVVGVGMVALPTGILASAYTEQLRRRTEDYRQQSDLAWRDGILSEQEKVDLENLREKLGLGEHTASQILDGEKVRAMLRLEQAQCCPHCGAPTEN